jgi:hypothetical protein
MPIKKRISAELPSDELLLAAIERAERHHGRDDQGVLLATLKEHLGLSRDGWTTRRLRPQLEELQTAGHMVRYRQHGCIVWGLTSDGRKRLEAARKAGVIGTLPESPQHRTWRKARTAATVRISQFRDELREALDDAISLLDHDDPSPLESMVRVQRTLETRLVATRDGHPLPSRVARARRLPRRH